ncbi:hypothetical protein ZYGR_0E01640 [Zygosaccharomyces rouxii]|uniref:ZYRO0B03630p n=2 Tax=Zygosaccharomyces rouxii TaxID=4956 RepID=C5DQW9_ZYGRC|nr:uncharacterized protein ZYRO0B03630g [Zygosaccharomyces rouxii]KAH9200271.1 hypothetical protein LQ764DRAFT_114197 [Zygosaccharomyces rouxii]GAV47148.1 hypothetical protein ZYGR_0E01640 [Zygosaccharomyces rouxii]CAR26180.1 ZYRO0B03630p [Zygosaccharomyces rouxii]
MPGKIESTAFLSQLEDMDKYLLEYRSLKLMPQVTNAFGAMRFNNNNFEMDNDLLKNSKKLNGINGGNNNNNNNNNSNNNNNNRKKFMNKQAFRLNSPTAVKFPHTKAVPPTAAPTAAPAGATTPLVNSHNFNKANSATYPLYYNTANNNSNASLAQPPLSSSTSSPSFVPPRVDSSLSGYDPTFDYVVPTPTPTDYTNQFSTPFSSYLNSGINPNMSSSVGATTAGTPVASSANLATSGSSDMVNNLVGTNTFNSGVSAPLAFDQPLPTSSISASMGASGLASTPTTADLSGNNLGSDQLLMNDLSLGWGSNHVSSAGAGNYGIWNNDMSVWS